MQCADGTYYTGITTDLDKRLKVHNSGKASKYTAARLPVKMAYRASGFSESEAKKCEAEMKRLKRGEKEKLVHREIADKNKVDCTRRRKSKGKLITNLSNQCKKVYLSKKSERMAELVGILIGDGGITDYQVTITLNRITDKKYSEFVLKLINSLFHLQANKNYRESTVKIQVSRKNLVQYLIKLGLTKGNKIKQNVDIPDWIIKKRSYSLACLRGLIDTDGCFYSHKYQSKGKIYKYTKIAFSSRSSSLKNSVLKILRSESFNPEIDCRGGIRLYRIRDVKHYYRIVGSHNPKHIEKFKKRYGEVA